jgi:hypothetical protein
VDPLLVAGKISKNSLVTGGFQYYFAESQAAARIHFPYQFRVFEEGY